MKIKVSRIYQADVDQTSPTSHVDYNSTGKQAMSFFKAAVRSSARSLAQFVFESENFPSSDDGLQ